MAYRVGKGLFLMCCLAIIVRSFQLETATKSTAFELIVHETSKDRGFAFTHQSLKTHRHQNLSPWVESLGASVAVADVNGDGFQDIFLTSNQPGQSQLYINLKNGQFANESAAYGLDKLSEQYGLLRPIFFDCDNDGIQEIFATRLFCPAVYKLNQNGKFREHFVVNDFENCFFAMASTVVDLNNDGLLDLVYAGHSLDQEGQFNLPTNFFGAKNGTSIATYINQGQCQFAKQENALQTSDHYFYHSFGIGDFRNSGNVDIWAAVDFNQDQVFQKVGDEFRNSSQQIDYYSSRSGMNSEVAYLDPDFPSIFVTHLYEKHFVTGGNSLWNFDGSKFVNSAKQKGLYQCQWAWGAKFFDIENDGDLDLAVANGFYSGPKKQNYWYQFSILSGTASPLSANKEVWPEMNGRSLSGFQKDCLFINDNNQFVQIEAESFDSDRLDGRAVAVIDADNRGRQSLVVANQKGRVYFYDFQSPVKNNWVGFSLRGKNWTAVGAKIKIKTETHNYTSALATTNSYAAQSESRIHFGLGQEKLQEVIVEWPSGKKQKLGPLAENRYHEIKEL